jgi:hypothetical protein
MGLGSVSRAEAATSAAATHARGFPDVPGMRGDRKANEFWYRFDEELSLAPSRRLTAAYKAIGSHVGGDIKNGLRGRWLALSRLPEYPRNFISFVKPLAGALEVVSAAQLEVIDRFYPAGGSGIVAAFAYFGQGVLYDPRRADIRAEVHTMGDLTGYHTWHAYQRAMMLLGIDRRRWAELAPVAGFAWAVQSVAMPGQRVVNPPLPERVMKRLAYSWLTRDQSELDEAFQSVPRPRHPFFDLPGHSPGSGSADSKA